MVPEVTGRGSPARESFLQDSLKSQEDLNLGLRASGSFRRRADLGSRPCCSRQTGTGEPELILPFPCSLRSKVPGALPEQLAIRSWSSLARRPQAARCWASSQPDRFDRLAGFARRIPDIARQVRLNRLSWRGTEESKGLSGEWTVISVRYIFQESGRAPKCSESHPQA
jgi:hypothetical protein